MSKLIAIGKIKEKAMVELLKEYEKRLKTIDPLQCIEIPNAASQLSNALIIEKESDLILAQIKPTDFVILLELKGKDLSSNGLSELMVKHRDLGKSLVFVIGGSYGVNDEVRSRADFLWKLSSLTFPHQLVRVLLYEQIYRAWMISINHPYHK